MPEDKKSISDILAKRWVHSYEDDTNTAMVFRPEDSFDPDLPSRGRVDLFFKPDHTFVGASIGATDVPEVKQGVWSVDDAEAEIQIQTESGSSRTLKLVELKDDKLVISKE